MMPDPRAEALQAVQEAMQALRLHQAEAARHWAQRAVDLAPELEDSWLVLAAAASDPRDSVTCLQRALAINPQSPRARQGMVWAVRRLRENGQTAVRAADTAPVPVKAPVAAEDTAPLQVAAAAVEDTAPVRVQVPQGDTAPVRITGKKHRSASRLSPAQRRAVWGWGALACVMLLLLTWLSLSLSDVLPESLRMLPGMGYSDAAPATTFAPSPTQFLLPSRTPESSHLLEWTATAEVMPSAAASPQPTATAPSTPLPTATPIPTMTPPPTAAPTDARPAATAQANSAPVSNLPAGSPTEPPVVYPTFIATLPAAAQAALPPPAPQAEPGDQDVPVASNENWVDVDLSDQRAYAYTGDQLVRSFVVSTGTWEHPTVTGQYNIYVKYAAADMAGPGYYLPNVPYVMYFYKGYGLHGTYWHNNFGTPMSHGCVNFQTEDAAWLFQFASVGTLVNVHP